jgi:TonB family protein
MVALIFGVQVGLIFWLGGTAPIRPRPTAAGLILHLAQPASAELRALDDPTLFTLPHPQGFSGPVWLRMPWPELRSFEWSAPSNHVFLALDQPGVVFNRLVETNEFRALRLPARPEAVPAIPDLPPLAILADQSVLQTEGSLAQRRLLAPFELKSWPNPDILKNSVVQAVMDDEGRPVSVTLLSGSGSPAADQYALEKARAARFEPVNRNRVQSAPGAAAHLSWGKLIFRWHTIPVPPASNGLASP